MNRAQRRKLARQINTPQKQYEVTGIALARQKADMLQQFQQEKQELFDTIMIMTAYVLNYKCSFGRKRLPEIMNDILFNLDAFRTGHLKLEDLENIKKTVEKKGFKV